MELVEIVQDENRSDVKVKYDEDKVQETPEIKESVSKNYLNKLLTKDQKYL